MSKDKPVTASAWRELFQLGLYKRSQGRITRQVTFAAVALVFLASAWRLNTMFVDKGDALRYGLPGALALVGLWLSYRLVNVPRFADFLIAVEAEMNKVSWPSRGELFRSAIVVIVVMFGLAAILFFYDFLWQFLLGRLTGSV